VAQGEGQDLLLEVLGGGVGHPRSSAFPGPKDLQPKPVDLLLPPVVRGVVDPHGPARGPHPDLLSKAKQPHPEPEQGIILSQGGASFLLEWLLKQEDASPSTWGVGPPQVSLQLGDATP
jgi:hypothetical protein